jgi:Tfp pilus assembly protein PilX
MSRRSRHQEGFALLLTLIVVGVVVSVGLTILDLTIKQLRLSTGAKDSEIAFHAANAGLECGRYWRRFASSSMEAGIGINPQCFGAASHRNTHAPATDVTGNGTAHIYSYSFSWGSAPYQRCSEMQTLVMVADLDGAGLSVGNMTAKFSGFPNEDGTDSMFCEPGGRCTLFAARGFNRACADTYPIGTVQREVLLQF